MTKEEAVHNISVVTGESEDVVERGANAVYKIHSLPIVNCFNNEVPFEKPRCKSYISSYAKFDKIRRKRK